MMTKIYIVKDDITNLKVEAIVNPANESLLAGSGLCGLIHKKAGKALEKACLEHSPCKTGQSIITSAYDLPFKYIIHTIGPKYYLMTGEENKFLTNCYKSIFDLVSKHKIKSIAIPSISTGIYKYPIEEASKIALASVDNFLNSKQKNILEKLIICTYNERDFIFYTNLFEKYNNT